MASKKGFHGGTYSKANILAAESPVTGEVFNVGSGWPVELMHVIGVLERITAKKVSLEYMPVQKGDLRDTWADIRKISGMLGFEPSTPLEKGLERQIEYIKKYI